MRRTEAEPWLFAGTGLRDRMTFGNGGIEIDKTAPTSPKGVHVLAEIPNLFGPGFTAQMTYYETARGAKVFAAGAFRLVTEPLQAADLEATREPVGAALASVERPTVILRSTRGRPVRRCVAQRNDHGSSARRGLPHASLVRSTRRAARACAPPVLRCSHAWPPVKQHVSTSSLGTVQTPSPCPRGGDHERPT